MNEVPLRTQAASWIRGGLKNRAGSLLLFPDRLVHVGSRVAQVGGGFGLIGVLVTRSVANAQAAGRAAAGGKLVLEIPFRTIAELRGSKGKLGSNFLVVRTMSGEEYRFGGIKLETWSEDLQRLLGQGGLEVTATNNGFLVR